MSIPDPGRPSMFRPPTFGAQDNRSAFQGTQSTFGAQGNPSVFGTSQAGSSVFGQAPQVPSTFGMAQAPQQSSNIFGTPSQQTTGSSMFGNTVPPSPFGVPPGTFNPQPTVNTMNTVIRSGTANPPYSSTREIEHDMQVTFKSISAMPAYALKSYEELRLEDYAAGRKGPTNPFQKSASTVAQPSFGTGLFGKPAGTSTTTGTFGGYGAAPGAPGGLGTFGQAPSSSSFGTIGFGSNQQPSTSGLFGNQGGFGGQQALSSGQQPPSSTFGQQASVFGAQPPASSSSGNLFGQPSTQPPSSLFGNQPVQTPQAQQLPFGGFGQASSATTSNASTSLFGQAPQPSAFGMFGSAQPSGVSAPAATTAPSSSGLWGTQPSNNIAPPSSSALFGSQKPLFGSSGSVNFGQPSATANQPPSQASNLFGNLQAPSSTSISQPQSANLFGNIVNPSISSSQPSFFGNQQTTSNMFNTSASTPAPVNFNMPQSIASSNQSSLFANKPLFPVTGTTSGSSGNLFGGGMFGQPQPTQPPNASLTSIAPPLPSALNSITIVPSPSVTPVKPSKQSQSVAATGSSWRIKLRESADSITAPAEPILHPSISKPATLIPRRFKSLTIEQQPAASESAKPEASKYEAFIDKSSSQFGDFFTSPSEAVLKRYSEDQLKSVSGFIAGQKGTGQIRFLKPVDLTGISLDNLFRDYIVFAPNQVVVYPQVEKKAPPGSGLNQPAEISLERCWPVSRSTRLPITDVENDRYKQHIERLKNMEDVKFVDFQNDSGTWIFQVEHFSGYGVPEEYRVVDDCNVTEDVMRDVDRAEHVHKDFSVRPVDNIWQAPFRTSIDCHGRVATIKGSNISFVNLEDSQADFSAIQTLLNAPHSNPDLSLILSAQNVLDNQWLAEAVSRWCPDAVSISPLHAALFCGNLRKAEKEAAAFNRPWLAALLVSDAPLENCFSWNMEDDVSKLCTALLSGNVDGIAEKYSSSNAWLLDYALRAFYSSEPPRADRLNVVARTFPNNRPIPDILSSILSKTRPVFNPEAIPFKIPGIPDLLIPYIISRELGYPNRSLQLAAFEQLLHINQPLLAGLLIEGDSEMQLSLHSRFPTIYPCRNNSIIRGIASAWSFRLKHDPEAEFDAWISAGLIQKATTVFQDHLADQYVLSGEHGRLAARLTAIEAVQTSDIYQLYLKVRLEKNQQAATDLTRRLENIPATTLRKRIAFAEMAAACSLYSESICKKYLPPELIMLHCHRRAINS